MKTVATLQGALVPTACCSCRQTAKVKFATVQAKFGHTMESMGFLLIAKDDGGRMKRGFTQDGWLHRTRRVNGRLRCSAGSDSLPVREDEISEKRLMNLQSLERMKQKMQRLGLSERQMPAGKNPQVGGLSEDKKPTSFKEKLLQAKVERGASRQRVNSKELAYAGKEVEHETEQEMLPVIVNEVKLDRLGRLKSRRAGRELALSILYAAVVLDQHPLDVFYQRLNSSSLEDGEDGVDMKSLLKSYGVMGVDNGHGEGARDDAEEAALIRIQELEADKDAAVLTSPLVAVYNCGVLTFVEALLRSAAELWPQHEDVVDELLHWKWKDTGEGVMPTCILHLALVELGVVAAPVDNSVQPKVVISEATHLAKRFCDGAAPRRIGGCLANLLRKRTDLNLNERTELGSDEPLLSLTGDDLGWNDGYQ